MISGASVDVLGLLVAALGGAAVGLERQRAGKAEGPRARFAGIRTFTLLGGLGGLAGWLWTIDMTVPAAIVLTGIVAIVAVAYVAASRTDIDGTTEVAALVVVTAGVIAGAGHYRLASGVIALTSLLLVEKSRLHSLVAKIDDAGLRAGVRFAAMALVVLPLLSEGPFGPFDAVRPRRIWLLVLFFSGLSFLGYITRRIVGPRAGHFMAGLLGGLISSTNVTFTFARLSRADVRAAADLAFGAVAANAVLYIRVLAALAVLNLAVCGRTLPYLIGPGVIAAAIAGVGAWRGRRAPEAPASPITNPLQLMAAIQMAVVFQVVLIVVAYASRFWGDVGLLGSAAVLGLTDVDALTVSVATGTTAGVPDVAARALAIGVLSNTLLKLALALAIGRGAFRLVAGGALATVAVASVVALLWF